MKLLALFLVVLTVVYLLPFSVFAEKTAKDAVIRGEIEVSGNTEASYPDETNGRTADSLRAMEITRLPTMQMACVPQRAITARSPTSIS